MAILALLSIPMSSISLCVIALIGENFVEADKCSRQLCGYTAPTTFMLSNSSCFKIGDSYIFSPRLNWNDGTYSVYRVQVNTQIVIGSCCSAVKGSFYSTGLVTSGRFSGENVILVFDYIVDRQTCNGCQSSVGLTRVRSDAMLSIGTKGVGNWIECTGNATILFSPALTSNPQTIYRTLQTVWNDCSTCVDTC